MDTNPGKLGGLANLSLVPDTSIMANFTIDDMDANNNTMQFDLSLVKGELLF